MTHSIEILLNLKEKNIQIEDHLTEVKLHKGVKSFFLYGKTACDDTACPECGVIHTDAQIVKNGTRASRITLMPFHKHPMFLVLSKQRYYCRVCSKSFTDKTPKLVADHSFISNEVKLSIVDSAARDAVSKKHIAQEHAVSVHTVQRAITAVAKDLKPDFNATLPKYLCFDEFKSTKEAQASMSFIYIDGHSHDLIGILPGRTQKIIRTHFLKYSRANRQQVEAICIDMNSAYMPIIKQLFPNAQIVVDRFHIVQAINREFNKCRVSAMNRCQYKDTRLYNKLKRYWKVLLKDQLSLTSTVYRSYRLFDWYTHERGIVDYLLAQTSDLKTPYHLMQNLRYALRHNNYDLFMDQVYQGLADKTLPRGVKRVLRTFRKYQASIKNTMANPKVTNGPIEGLNNKIKVVKRNGYGYRNHDNLMHRIYLTCKLYKNKKRTAA